MPKDAPLRLLLGPWVLRQLLNGKLTNGRRDIQPTRCLRIITTEYVCFVYFVSSLKRQECLLYFRRFPTGVVFRRLVIAIDVRGVSEQRRLAPSGLSSARELRYGRNGKKHRRQALPCRRVKVWYGAAPRAHGFVEQRCT